MTQYIFKRTGFKLSFFILLFISQAAFAQRQVSYEQLTRRGNQSGLHVNSFALPADTETGDKLNFVTTIRFPYQSLPFRKLNDPQQKQGFFSPVGFDIEIFKEPESDQKGKRADTEIAALQPVTRAIWRDTAFAASYEHTKSETEYITGLINVELEPGSYRYVLTVRRGTETERRTSNGRQITLESPVNKKQGTVLLAKELLSESPSVVTSLMGLRDFVYYGEKFFAVVWLPDYSPSSEYILKVHRMRTGGDKPEKQDEVYTTGLDSTSIYTDIIPRVTKGEDDLLLELNPKMNGYAYALVEIPNHRFPNAVYQVEVTRKGQKAPVAQSIFRSLWVDMPVSLLNLDVSIDMLRFIVDDGALKQLKSGSQAEREKKFREFWKKRDPTPNTEFNELMAEYYRRIDYTYDNFTTLNTTGYNTDQGKIYIRYGPPNNIERTFPPGQQAVETWTYDDRKFVFRATSGFGEFKLVDS